MRRRFEIFFPRHSPEDLFALADDVEAYPDFVPACRAARVLDREGTWRRVENVFGFGALRFVFISEARADPPRELVVESQNGPIRDFRLLWRFAPRGDGCLLTCDLTLELKSRLLDGLALLAAPAFERKVIADFERRAAALAKEKGRA